MLLDYLMGLASAWPELAQLWCAANIGGITDSRRCWPLDATLLARGRIPACMTLGWLV